MDDLTAAQGAVATLLASLTASDWSLASPCEGWTVEDVVRHVIVGDRAFTTSLRGTRYDLAAIGSAVSAVAVEELDGLYAAGVLALQEALLAAAGGAEFPTGIGPMTAASIESLRTLEALVHGWDVAVSVGRSLDVTSSSAERSIPYARALRELVPNPESRFGTAHDVAGPGLERLVAVLGRVR